MESGIINSPSPTVVVIGGGAAGFFGAIVYAEANPRAKVIILERGQEVLQKVKISGGGRCNVTHACFIPRELVKYYPRGEKALIGPFSRFSVGDTIEWFEKRGVALKIEGDGRMFPTTDSSQTIVDCLQEAAAKAGVEVRKGVRVDKIIPGGIGSALGTAFLVKTSAGDYSADKVLVAAGSSTAVWEMLRSLGHTIVHPVPSLFTFNTKDPRIFDLAGLSVPQAEVSIVGLVQKRKAHGPLLITHWGLSGPAVLRLSAWGARELADAQYQFGIQVNWIAGQRMEEVVDEFKHIKLSSPKKQVMASAQYGLPARLWKGLVAAVGIPEGLRWADITGKQLMGLAAELTQGSFTVNGRSVFKEEFVTAGGVELNEVNFKTFESKVVPGLYFAGETLNIDAITGGFNFQAAWTGGWIAGNGLAGH